MCFVLGRGGGSGLERHGGLQASWFSNPAGPPSLLLLCVLGGAGAVDSKATAGLARSWFLNPAGPPSLLLLCVLGGAGAVDSKATRACSSLFAGAPGPKQTGRTPTLALNPAGLRGDWGLSLPARSRAWLSPGRADYAKAKELPKHCSCDARIQHVPCPQQQQDNTASTPHYMYDRTAARQNSSTTTAARQNSSTTTAARQNSSTTTAARQHNNSSTTAQQQQHSTTAARQRHSPSPRACRVLSQAEAQKLDSKSCLVYLHHSDLTGSSTGPPWARVRYDPAKNTLSTASNGYTACPITSTILSLRCMFYYGLCSLG